MPAAARPRRPPPLRTHHEAGPCKFFSSVHHRTVTKNSYTVYRIKKDKKNLYIYILPSFCSFRFRRGPWTRASLSHVKERSPRVRFEYASRFSRWTSRYISSVTLDQGQPQGILKVGHLKASLKLTLRGRRCSRGDHVEITWRSLRDRVEITWRGCRASLAAQRGTGAPGKEGGATLYYTKMQWRTYTRTNTLVL